VVSTAILTIGNKQIPYYVQRGTNSKYIRLKFTKNLELEITLPEKSDIDVEIVLRKKRTWIERKYHILSNRKCVFDNRHVLYRGTYLDVCRAPSNSDEPGVIIQDNKVIVRTNGRERNYLLALRDWMKTETTKCVTKKLEKYTQRFGINFRNVYVKTTKQWGYCTSDRDLIFNWQLIALPDALADYVILHELAHLLEFNHSKRFRVTLASMCPDFKERRDELNYFCTSNARNFQL
jgi:predicted metal-dependent hydrolase